MPALVAARALIITGTVGAGKTAVAVAAGHLLRDSGVHHALVDLDALSRLWPHPPGDRFNEEVAYRNLTCVWRNYREAGARCLLLAAVLERDQDLSRLTTALPDADLDLVRLLAPPELTEARLRRRHRDGPELDWHLQRAPELAAIQDGLRSSHSVVENGERPLRDVAADVLRVAGWLPREGFAPGQRPATRPRMGVKPAQRR